MVTLTALVTYLDQLLQPARFQDYAPNGLQVEGGSSTDIQTLVTGVTASQALLEAAIAKGLAALQKPKRRKKKS